MTPSPPIEPTPSGRCGPPRPIRSCESWRPNRTHLPRWRSSVVSRRRILQILGSDSLPVFHDATYALDDWLGDSRIVVIDGARHAAHHTHPEAFVAAVRAFLT